MINKILSYSLVFMMHCSVALAGRPDAEDMYGYSPMRSSGGPISGFFAKIMVFVIFAWLLKTFLTAKKTKSSDYIVALGGIIFCLVMLCGILAS